MKIFPVLLLLLLTCINTKAHQLKILFDLINNETAYFESSFENKKIKDNKAIASDSDTKFYRCSFRDDPSTSIVIGWCDNGVSVNTKVYYDTTDFDTAWANYQFIHNIDRTVFFAGVNNRFARITGLIPNTVYYFVIHDDQSTSVRLSFKTLSDNPDVPLTFISGGDSRTGTESEIECRPARQNANRMVSKIRPDFITFSGDFVNIDTNDTLWSDWLTDWQLTISQSGRLIPIIPTFGNHESADYIYNLFDVPDSNAYFALGIGGNLLRLYSINSMLGCDTSQISWLTNDLQLHTSTADEPYWKAVEYHYTLVPHAMYSDQTALIGCWTDLFQQYKMTLALEGHAHVQKITYPIIPSSAAGSDHGFIRNDSTGTVYIGEGGWGAPLRDLYTFYNANKAYNWTKVQGKFYGFNVICVSKTQIEIRTVKTDSITGVGQVTENDPPCTLPAGLVLLLTPDGYVVTIYNYATALNIPVFNNKIEVSPNPVKKFLDIIFKNNSEILKIEVYNGLGFKMTDEVVKAGSVTKQIDFTFFPSGTYYIFIKGKTVFEKRKVIHIK